MRFYIHVLDNDVAMHYRRLVEPMLVSVSFRLKKISIQQLEIGFGLLL